MSSKTQAYLELANRTANGITRHWEHWANFLTAASRLYKYNFADQLMIYAQRPDATACASFDLWNNRMNRYIRKGSQGIALLDESSGYPRLHYVFDLADTGERRKSHTPYFWELNDDFREPVARMLAEEYGIHNESLGQQITDVTAKLADDYWENNSRDILGIVDDSLLMDYDEAGKEYRVQEDGTCTNHVNSPKTKAGIRIIPMLDEVFDAFLEEYQYQKVIGFCTDEIDGYSGFVFCTGDGKVYLPNAINRTIRSICADYNKEEESKAKEENRDPVLLPKFSCHILRHTFCTRFCENETNLMVIQEIMGHADISTTMDVYAEATQEKKKESMTSLQSALLVR